MFPYFYFFFYTPSNVLSSLPSASISTPLQMSDVPFLLPLFQRPSYCIQCPHLCTSFVNAPSNVLSSLPSASISTPLQMSHVPFLLPASISMPLSHSFTSYSRPLLMSNVHFLLPLFQCPFKCPMFVVNIVLLLFQHPS